MTMRQLLPFFLLVCGVSVCAAENLLPAASFETPVVQGRTPLSQGGDPTNSGRGPLWISFRFAPEKTGTNGSITGGLTNDVSHGGKQSLFIDFNHVQTPYQSATLVSNFIPIVSGTDYQVGIWGRTDAKDVFAEEDRPAYLKVEVDFFAADANESVGEPVYAVLPIPGGKDHPAFFTPDDWHCFQTKLTSPPGAVFAQITWRWETGGNQPGEINGIMYFDGLSLVGPPNPVPNLTPVPVQMPSDTGTDAALTTGT